MSRGQACCLWFDVPPLKLVYGRPTCTSNPSVITVLPLPMDNTIILPRSTNCRHTMPVTSKPKELDSSRKTKLTIQIFSHFCVTILKTWISQGGLGEGLGKTSSRAGSPATLNRSTVCLLLVTAVAVFLSVVYLMFTRIFTKIIMHITLVLTIILNIGILLDNQILLGCHYIHHSRCSLSITSRTSNLLTDNHTQHPTLSAFGLFPWDQLHLAL